MRFLNLICPKCEIELLNPIGKTHKTATCPSLQALRLIEAYEEGGECFPRRAFRLSWVKTVGHSSIFQTISHFSRWSIVPQNVYVLYSYTSGWAPLMPEEWKERITVDPKVLAGKPIIKGTRIAVEFILDLLANGWTTEKILKNYPQLKKEDIMAVLKYATEILTEEKVYPLP